MDNYSPIALGMIILLLLTLFIISLVLQNLIKRQIDKQMKDMIPIKAIRDRIGIRIKFRK